MSASVDWCEWSVPLVEGFGAADCASDWAAFLGGMVPSGRGMWGYANSAAVLGSGRIAWDDERRDMGVHVSLPASALGRLAAVGLDFATIYCRVRNSGGKFTRIDIACDSRSVSMDVVLHAIESNYVVSRARSIRLVRELRGAGCTVYVGSGSSDTMVRFYDKAAERGLTDVVWTRCEVQLRRNRADSWADLVYLGDSLASYFRGVVDFRDRASESNVSRAEPVDWWLDWLGDGSDVVAKIVQVAARGDVAAWEAWIAKQVAPSLAAVFLARGGDMGYLREVLANGGGRIPGWKHQIIALAIRGG